LAVFGLGLALGVVLGSGTTLLVAPESGKEVRARLRRRGRRLQMDARDAWDDLRDELRWKARRLKRGARRKLVRAGWGAADRAVRSRRRVAC
jgi:gas vesicle protein